MREEKYSNIVSENKETIEEQKEKDLSLTRELKFSALQERLDKDSEDQEEILSAEERIALAKKRLEAEQKEKLDASSDFSNLLVPEQKNKNDDDIYITKTLKPVKLPRKIFKIVFKLAFFCVFVFLLYFGTKNYLIPEVQKRFFATPLNIFEKNLEGLIDYVEKLDEFDYQDVFKVETDIKINSNIDGFAELKDYNFLTTTYYGKENNLFANQYTIAKDDASFSYTIYEKNNNMYDHFSTSSNIYNHGEITELVDESFQNRLANAYYSDFPKKLILKELNLLKDELMEENITSTDDELTFNDITMSVKRISFTLEGKKLDEFLKKNEEELLKDDLINSYIDSFNIGDEADVTSNPIEEIIDELINDLDSLSINLYTDEKNKFVGVDIEENGFRTFHYYTDQANLFSIYLNLGDTNAKEDSENSTIELVGRKKSTTSSVDVLYNTKEIGSLVISAFTPEKISLTYEVYVDDIKFSGDLLIYNDHENRNIEFSVRSLGNFLNITTKDKYSKQEKIEDFDNFKTTNYLEEPYTNESSTFLNALREKNMLDAFNAYLYFLSPEEDEETETPPPAIDNGVPASPPEGAVTA